MKKDAVRIDSLRALIKERKLDALIFFHPENILLSTGMLPGAAFAVCVLTKSGQVIVISPWWREAEYHSEEHSYMSHEHGLTQLQCRLALLVNYIHQREFA